MEIAEIKRQFREAKESGHPFSTFIESVRCSEGIGKRIYKLNSEGEIMKVIEPMER